VRGTGIAIAGGSCSGKTTLALLASDSLDSTLVRIDDYYRPLDHLTFDERCHVNFDHPDAIDHPLLCDHIEALLNGHPVESPSYDFTRHTRFAQGHRVQPARVLIVEGLFALCYPRLVDLLSVRVFVHAPEEVCLERRIARDVAERGRTPEEVSERFASHVSPMFRKHILPSSRHATLTVSGIRPIEEGLDKLLERIAAPQPL
jgi:uridine kinase